MKEITKKKKRSRYHTAIWEAQILYYLPLKMSSSADAPPNSTGFSKSLRRIFPATFLWSPCREAPAQLLRTRLGGGGACREHCLTAVSQFPAQDISICYSCITSISDKLDAALLCPALTRSFLAIGSPPIPLGSAMPASPQPATMCCLAP